MSRFLACEVYAIGADLAHMTSDMTGNPERRGGACPVGDRGCQRRRLFMRPTSTNIAPNHALPADSSVNALQKVLSQGFAHKPEDPN